MTLALAIILFLLSAFDAWLTRKRIARYGVSVELNASIRWLANKIGPELGAILGVMVPATGLILMALGLHLQWVLALLVGFRARQFFVQIESLTFEKNITEFAARLKAASISGSRSHPSRSTPLHGVESVTSRTLSSEEKHEG